MSVVISYSSLPFLIMLYVLPLLALPFMYQCKTPFVSFTPRFELARSFQSYIYSYCRTTVAHTCYASEIQNEDHDVFLFILIRILLYVALSLYGTLLGAALRLFAIRDWS